MLALLSFTALLFLSIFTFQPYYKEEEKAHAEGAPNAVSSELVLDVVSNSADLHFAMLGAVGDFASSGESIVFNASTNNVSGYTVKYAGNDDSGALMHEDGGFSFSSISTPLTANDFAASANTSYNNRWGFKPSKYMSNGSVINNTGDTGVFLPIPTTAGVVIDKTTAANSNNNDPSAANDYSIEIGARANYDMVGGEYASELSLAIVANPVSYRIAYDRGNTTDSVSGLPDTQNSATSATFLTISTDTPTRAHHSFIGWCDVLPTTTNGVDTCTGTNTITGNPATQYAPGDEYGINQTTTNNATLYAMWKIDTFTCTKQYRLENADGTWGSYTSDGTETVNYGSTCSYSKTVTNYKGTATGANNTVAATSATNVTSNQTLSLSLYRNTYTCAKQYRLEDVNGNLPSTYTSDGSVTVRHGGTCSYSKTINNYRGASNAANGAAGSTSASNVTSNQTLSLSFYRNLFTCTKQYRLENANGTWGSYVSDGSVTARYGGSCSYSKTVTDYRGASNAANGAAGSVSASDVGANQTLALSLYRNTYTLTVTAGTNTSSPTGGGTYRWGQAAAVGVTKATNVTCTSYATPTWTQSGTAGTFSATSGTSVAFTMGKGNATVTAISAASNVAQTITFKTVNATNISLNGTAKTNNQTMSINCGTYNLTGSIPSHFHFTLWSATAGTIASPTTLTTTYQVTGTATITLAAVIDTFTQTTRYRYENADGTWGSWTTAESVSKDYGSSYSWSTSQISGFNSTVYQAASVASYTVTAAKTNDVSIYRKTFTCTKQYRLQGTNAAYPSTYTADGTVTVRYGGSCTYTTTASTTIYNNQTKTESNMTANKTISIDVPRKTFTWSKQYRLENANGTWGNYTADGSVTAVYGGSCSYSKTVTDYRGASNAANGAAGSASASNVTSNQTLSISFYRNVYTLTVTAGTNTSSATGGGTYRWGQAATVGVTKATNVTCTSYGTPTWTQSGTTGTFSATSGTSVYFTMGKGNATVTATSAASNVTQTITLSLGTGVASIKIGSTNYTAGSLSLACGNYSISGNYSSSYEFSSWARANGVAVTNTAAASTTMTVSGAGTLTLNAKQSKIYLQNVTLADCTTTARTAHDSRDETAYTIQRLADGKCWMLDNLSLGSTESILLKTTDTNIARDYTLSAHYEPIYTYDSSAGYSYYVWQAIPVARIYVTDKDKTLPYGDGNGRTGVYYNLCAASAGTNCSTTVNNMSYDICPKGWRIPTAGASTSTTEDWNALDAAYNRAQPTLRNALHLTAAGQIMDGASGKPYNQNSQGNYWASSRYSSSSNYYINFSHNYQNNGIMYTGASGMSLARGNSVRCVLK